MMQTYRKAWAATAVGTVCLVVGSAASAIQVTENTDAADLRDALVVPGTGINISSVDLASHNTGVGGQFSSGTYTNMSGIYGINDGIILSTGDVLMYEDGPNTETGLTATGTAYGVLATAQQEALLDQVTGDTMDQFGYADVTQFTLEFNVESGVSMVEFDVVFGSEEWITFVTSDFIDGFGLFLNGTNIAFVDGEPVNIKHPNMAAPLPANMTTELNGVLAVNSPDPGPPPNSSGPWVHTFKGSVDPTGNNSLTFILGDTFGSTSGTIPPGGADFDTTVYFSQLRGVATAAVPEPTGIALMGLGLTGLGFLRRLRRR